MTLDLSAVPFEPFYQRDGIVIYNADCRQVLPFLPRFDLLLTDPPYGVNFKGKATKHTAAKYGYLEPDTDIGPVVVAKAMEHCERGIVFSGNRLLHSYPKPNDIGCVYCPSGADVGPWGFICFHAVLFYGKRPGGPRTPASIESFATSPNVGHPCPKPLEWMKWAISLDFDATTVLDPFMGSGTTLVAAKLEGRQTVGIEISREYCEVAVERLRQGVLSFETAAPASA